jgi:hypothetical protein
LLNVLPLFWKILLKESSQKRSIGTFNGQLKTELWDDVYLQTDVNRAYSSFLTKFLKCSLHIFPSKQVSDTKRNKSGWITQGIKASRQRLQLLHLLKVKTCPSISASNYIKQYQRNYKKVISEAQRIENDRIIVMSKNHTKEF